MNVRLMKVPGIALLLLSLLSCKKTEYLVPNQGAVSFITSSVGDEKEIRIEFLQRLKGDLTSQIESLEQLIDQIDLTISVIEFLGQFIDEVDLITIVKTHKYFLEKLHRANYTAYLRYQTESEEDDDLARGGTNLMDEFKNLEARFKKVRAKYDSKIRARIAYSTLDLKAISTIEKEVRKQYGLE